MAAGLREIFAWLAKSSCDAGLRFEGTTVHGNRLEYEVRLLSS